MLLIMFLLFICREWSNIFVYVFITFNDKIQFNPIIIVFSYLHVFVIIEGFYLNKLFLTFH